MLYKREHQRTKNTETKEGNIDLNIWIDIQGSVGLTFRLGVQAHFNTVLVRKCTPFLITQRQPGTIGYSGQKQQNGKSFPILEELV